MKHDFCFFSRSPVTVFGIAQFWTMHHTKFQGLGDRHPTHCVWLSYTTTLKIHIRTYCILHITNVQVRSISLSYILHSTYLHHLTPTLKILEGPFSRILSIPALHPGLRWHPSRGHNLGDGVYDHFDPMVVAGIPTKVIHWGFMID